MSCDYLSDSSVTNCSDSSFHPSVNEDETNDSDDLYGGYTDTYTQSLPNHATDKMEDTQDELEEDDNDGLTDGEDDLSVEEMYSDFNVGGVHARKSCHKNDYPSNDNETTTPDNLVCSGNVLDYCTQHGHGSETEFHEQYCGLKPYYIHCAS